MRSRSLSNLFSFLFMTDSINDLLAPFARFGINLGLTRIKSLLNLLGNPQDSVPLVHVAGTNGKGSVCAYLASVLSTAGYRVGRYTSPHLVHWTERINLNGNPISEADLVAVLQEVTAKAQGMRDVPTQFEIITAAAWVYFAQEKVDVAVMEVGLGGRLDATNVSDSPLVSIIVSLSREHWQRLGPTVADIAREKAGVLKQNCPAVIGQLPSDAAEVVKDKIAQLNCPAVWVKPAKVIKEAPIRQVSYNGIEYPLPLLGEMQLINSAVAVAALQTLQDKGWNIPDSAIAEGMAQTQWQGRMQWYHWQGRQILIDGAHNTAAAQYLRKYVESLNKPVVWLMGMLSTKDHRDIFAALLRPEDSLYLVPVPEHSTADPQELAALATEVCPQLNYCETEPDLFTALNRIKEQHPQEQIVFCGSLYLIGYFLNRQE